MTTTTEPSQSVNSVGCFGATIPLASGSYFDLTNPDPDSFTLSDITTPLARAYRYTAHFPITIAAHSYCGAMVARALHHDQSLARLARITTSPSLAYAFLLHDASEAFTGDINKPLKNLIAPLFEPIEDAITNCINAKFQVPVQPSGSVKTIDLMMLAIEKSRFGMKISDGLRPYYDAALLLPDRVVLQVVHFMRGITPDKFEKAIKEEANVLNISI